jgi:hypothetical protein
MWEVTRDNRDALPVALAALIRAGLAPTRH